MAKRRKLSRLAVPRPSPAQGSRTSGSTAPSAPADNSGILEEQHRRNRSKNLRMKYVDL